MTRRSVIIGFVAILTLSSSSRADDPKKESQFDADKSAFLRARKAQAVKTWSAALLILKRIDLDKVEDTEVIEYVDFEQRCATLADKLGVSMESDPESTKSVISKAQLEKIVSSIIHAIQEKGIAEAVNLLAEARKVQKQIPRYYELDEILFERYGKG